MNKIAVVTATRAEYGLLLPLIQRIIDDDKCELDLIATGGHLSEKQGMTIEEIKSGGIPISHEISILEDDNSAYGVSLTVANAIKEFAKCFKEDRPDIVVILGDRTEMLGVAVAAMNERIPISHIHGGELTEGAVDDCVRHAITKMSYLHFTSSEDYRNRVIQLGENPERVFNVGALGAENILSRNLMSEAELRDNLKIPANKRYAVVTYHPVTLEHNSAEKQINELCLAMSSRPDIFFVITGANADTGGDKINCVLKTYADSHDNAAFTLSLGMIRYLSAVKYASFVLGNSSSGVIEAPVLGTPTVNIGDRQKGRLMAETVVCCLPDSNSIETAINEAEKMDHKGTCLFGTGNTSEQILNVITDFLDSGKIEIKKEFYDLKHAE